MKCVGFTWGDATGQPCIDSVTGKENNDYYWARKRDENNKLVENIYDVNNDKFILDEWIYDAGHGLINGHYANLIKVDEISQTEVYNKIDLTSMQLMYSKWLSGSEWISVLQIKDIIV